MYNAAKNMKKFILAPDSFKGTMSSLVICNIMEKAIRGHYPEAQVIKIPVADGGEGTVDCFLEAVGGKKVATKIKGPYFEEMDSFYGLLPDGKTAVVETAAAAGLPLVENRKNPALTTTYGVGQLIRHAVDNGCNRIIIGLGGSCTNDGGTGMAAALGIMFFDENNNEFIPTGGTIDRIARIDFSNRLKELGSCEIVAMCDVDNPLYGINGSAYMFGPQKGADENMIRQLDRNLEYLSELIGHDCGIDLAQLPGAGAAGGMGAGVVSFIGAELKPGIDVVMETVCFNEFLEGVDCVFTGEGKLDAQSRHGKVVVGIGRRTKLKNIPVIAVVGDIGDDIDWVYSEGISAVMSINRVAVSFAKARQRCESDLAKAMDTLMRIMKLRNFQVFCPSR